MHFSKTSGRLFISDPKFLAIGSRSSANFPILDSFIPNFKLNYEDLANIKTDHVHTVVFDSHEIKRRAFILGQLV